MTKFLRPQAVAAILALLAALGVGLRIAGTLLVVGRPVTNPDAIISLASHEWERLPTTARLARTNEAAVVVLTLPQPATIYNCHDCSGRLDRLQHLGIASDRVRIIPLTAPGTHGEALAAVAFARRTAIHRLLIVTTPYHTRRALAVFRSVFEGMPVEIGIEPASESSPAQPARWWASPYDRAYVAYEWAAALYYVVRYHVVIWT
ncbi:MAG: YdcF family protein [Acidobacteria bacterium]|nr:YdcF family protein [Acidobacteriota bacterium]